MKVVVFGIGKLADYVEYVLTNDSDFQVSGFCIEKDFMPEQNKIRGLEVVDFDVVNDLYPPAEFKMFIAVGNNVVREKIYVKAKEKGYSFISYISSKASFWPDLNYGENVFIGEGTTIQPFVSIGNNTIFFAAQIGHHSSIGNHVILSGCFLGGNVQIGDNSFLGLNSTVNQNVKIGRGNIIGVGSNISKDTGENEVYTNNGTVKRTISSERIKNLYLH